MAAASRSPSERIGSPVDAFFILTDEKGKVITEQDDGPELARAVVMLGETLGLETVAEGVEHEEQVAKLLLASQEVDEDAPPYGFAKADWRGLTERVDALADLLCEDEVDEDAVADSAKELRGALRPYV